MLLFLQISNIFGKLIKKITYRITTEGVRGAFLIIDVPNK